MSNITPPFFPGWKGKARSPHVGALVSEFVSTFLSHDIGIIGSASKRHGPRPVFSTQDLERYRVFGESSSSATSDLVSFRFRGTWEPVQFTAARFCHLDSKLNHTAHKAQGRTMERAIVDIAGCIGTEQPYVMVSRATSLSGVIVLHDFEDRQIIK